jgi:hypothetical protein
MAARYWVGGTGSWDATTTHWAATSGGAGGETVPGTGDDVYFDLHSNEPGDTAYTVTMGVAANCNNFDMSFTGTTKVTWAGAYSLNVYGNFYLSGGTAQITRTTTCTINMKATDTGHTFDSNGVSLAGNLIYFDGVAGGWSLSNNLTGGGVYVVNGAVDFNEKTLTLGSFHSSYTSTRSVDISNCTITCSSVSTQAFDVSTITALTWDATGSSVTVSSCVAGGFSIGNLAMGNVTFTLTAAAGGNGLYNTGTATYTNLTINGASAQGQIIDIYGTNTISGTLTITGVALYRLLVRSTAVGTARTMTAHAVSLSNVDFRDITGAGDAAPFTGTSLGDNLGNSGITFTTPVTRHWVGNGGNWVDTTHWSDTNGGSPGFSVPLAQDTVIFGSGSFSLDAQTVVFNGIDLGASVSFADVTHSPAITFSLVGTTSSGNKCYGNFTLKSGMTITSNTASLQFYNRTDATVDTDGVAWACNFLVACYGAKLTLLDDLILGSTRTFISYYGEFDADVYNVTAGLFDLDLAVNHTITMGSGTWTASGTGAVWDCNPSANLTLNAEQSTLVISDTSSTAKTFDGAATTYNNVTITGDAVTFVGNNVYTGTLSLNTGGLTTGTTFTANSTQTVAAFSTNGADASLVKIRSSSTTHATLTKSGGGLISEDYVDIDYMTGSPSLTWYMGTHSTDGTHNTAIYFTDIPPNTVSVYDSAVVTGVVSAIRLGANNVNVYDTPLVTDVLTSISASSINLSVSVYDSPTVTENATVTRIDTIPSNLFLRVGERKGVEIH